MATTNTMMVLIAWGVGRYISAKLAIMSPIKNTTEKQKIMTKEQLIKQLNAINEDTRDEDGNLVSDNGHQTADDLLLEYIDDVEIHEAYDAVQPKWYE